MTGPRPVRRAAPRRYTSAVLSGGVALAGVFFGVALALETLGADVGSGSMTDIGAVVDGLVALTPWAWATAGAYVVVVTPIVGLAVTAAEYWSISERGTVLLAAAVLAVLALSVLVAMLR
jgi:uncharacterized membrane protein